VFHLSRPDTWLHCVSASQTRSCPPCENLLPCVQNGVALEQLRTTVGKRDFALALGRICPEKGFHLGLDAAIEAGIPLIVAGEVFHYRDHEEYFRREMLPRLNGHTRRFIGPVAMPRKRRLLAAARCLLIPSLVPETSSLVAMEAMACGTPVIAIDRGSMPELIVDGTTGFLVEDVAGAVAAVAAAAALDRSAIRAHAVERFGVGRMVDAYVEVYETLLRSRS